MNRAPDIVNESYPVVRQAPGGRPSLGFTLVEMLVVISIIGILAGLIVPAAMMAVRHAKVAAISVEIKQLEAACQAYKEKLGEYPPDFAGLDNTNTDPATKLTYQVEVQNRVLQHLSTVFPRYQPGVTRGWKSTGWAGFLEDVSLSWGMNYDYLSNNPAVLSPSSALVFWLAGQPDWQRDNQGNAILPTPSNISDRAFQQNPVRGFLGFSANPLNPFDNGTSRITPFMDFHVGRCGWLNFTGTPGGLGYWANGTQGAKTTEPIMYFRAENGNYTMDGGPAVSGLANVKRLRTERCTTTLCTPINIWPAVDSGLSNPTAGSYSFVNPTTFQIFSAGLGMKYGSLSGPLMYPSGANYAIDTFDDITNFSGGTLEGKVP